MSDPNAAIKKYTTQSWVYTNRNYVLGMIALGIIGLLVVLYLVYTSGDDAPSTATAVLQPPPRVLNDYS